MNVVSYFEPIDSQFSRESSKLPESWSNNWQEKGWSTFILNESYAKKHSSFKDINFGNHESLLYSSKNSINYLKQCYMRWLAYSRYVSENGPTVWCDYDVYNKNLTPHLLKSITNEQSFVFSRSCCCGYLSTQRAKAIVDTIERCSKIYSINDIYFPEESKTRYFHSINPNLFSDMYIANCSFRDVGDIDLLEIACDLDQLDEQSIKSAFNNFNLFHIHGGANFSRFNSENTTRTNVWNYLNKL
jgi:hypothetical protein